MKKLRALPVGKLQSSFNVAGSWADMVSFFFFLFFVFTVGMICFFLISLNDMFFLCFSFFKLICQVPSPWKPMVDSWSSNPFLPKNPRLEFCLCLCLVFWQILSRLEFFQFKLLSPQKFGDFVLTSENLLQDKMSSTLFAYPAKTNTAAATIFLNLDFEGTP